MRQSPLRSNRTLVANDRTTAPISGNPKRFTLLAAMVVTAAAFRLVPHPPNFSPIASLALFAGATFGSKRAALAMPLLSMTVSDLILGYSWITPVVYASFALIVGLGFWVQRHRSAGRIMTGAVGGSFLFYLVTNFGVWAEGSLYPHTGAGLIDCYVAAIPFLRYTLASGLLYSALLFGGLALAERRFPGLREPVAVPI